MNQETDLRKQERMKSLIRAAFFVGLLVLSAQMATAVITFAPSSPNVGQTVTFTSSLAPGPPTTVTWSFGDGKSTIAGRTVSHVYYSAGTFSVSASWLGGSDNGIITIVERRFIEFSPPSPRVKEEITFYARNFLSNAVVWNFGDGTVFAGPTTAKHSYSKPGTYIVRAYENGGTSISASASIVVYPAASIAFSPADPRPGQPVTFNALYFFSTTLIRWDFGDGTVENDTTPPSITHSYSNPGAYAVRAYDGGATTPTATLFVQVWPPRAIVYSPSQVRTGGLVTFRGQNFLSESIQWNFGDGSPPVQGGKEISHTYQSAGMFTVTAADLSGGLPVPVSVSLVVYPSQGPRAKFSVSFIQLRFDDGTNYKVVPKNFAPLKALAEIKYEGTGNFYAQWMVDGVPFRMVSQSLAFAQQIVLDSGEIPGLPTIIPGIHDVTLNIIQPQVEFVVPVIRYFVTAKEGVAALADLSVSGATRLDQAEIVVAADSVEAPSGDYFLLQGLIKNQSRVLLPFVLLRVYLEDKLIDERLVRDLKPDEERPFESSVYNNSSEPKNIYLFLYDIAQKPSRLLFIKEVKLIPAGDK
jgi:PKD repeat protein